MSCQLFLVMHDEWGIYIIGYQQIIITLFIQHISKKQVSECITIKTG